MSKFDLTIKNYRCFEDKNPLRLTIQDGFIALVGPNNSGKSSCLKFFYELRNIWSSLSNNIESLLRLSNEQNRYGFDYVDVFDKNEVYNDDNNREMSVEIELKDVASNNEIDCVTKIIFYCDRTWWRAKLYQGHNHDDISAYNLKSDKSYGEIIFYTDRKLEQVFYVDCSKFLQLFKSLATCCYIGPFRNVITEGEADYFDLTIGSKFISQWNDWKTGSVKSNNKLIEKVTRDIENIFEFKSLEINSSESLNTLQVLIEGKPYKLKELGAGISQFIVVLANIAIKKPDYVLIDEPELNLHPSLQLDFLTTIGSYTSKSVIFATHSIGLSRSVADRVYSFSRKLNDTKVKSLERQDNYAEYLGELSYSSYREIGCQSVLLVEGVKDVKTVQQFLRKFKKDHKVVILPLGGDQLAVGGTEQELAELKRLSEDIYVLVDSERISENSPICGKRQQFKKACDELGFNVHLTAYRAIENYFTDNAVKSVKGGEYKALKPYEKLSESCAPWGKHENWKIAREMTLEEIYQTDIGKFLSSIQ